MAAGRARSKDQKLARRTGILQVAVECLATEGYDELTMASLAQACGLAKGTLYLYFDTKETLFLAALEAQYVGWLEHSARALQALSPPTTPAGVSGCLMDVVTQHPRLVQLMSVVHGVLEKNASVEAVYAYKAAALQQGLHTAAILHGVAPWLSIDEAAHFMLRFHALMSVVHPMRHPAPVAIEVLKRPELAPLCVDFDLELLEMLTDLLAAAKLRGEQATR